MYLAFLRMMCVDYSRPYGRCDPLNDFFIRPSTSRGDGLNGGTVHWTVLAMTARLASRDCLEWMGASGFRGEGGGQ